MARGGARKKKAASPLAAALACASSQSADVDEHDDVRERLLNPRDRDGADAGGSTRDPPTAGGSFDSENESDEHAFTHEELLHAVGSFSTIVWPVTATMLIASFVSINVVDPAMAEALSSAYLVYGPSEDASATDGTKFGQAMVNALVIVCFFLVATFVIVACYKYNFNRMLIGYMMFSSAMLLGLLGGNILIITMGQLEIVVDALTFWIAMYNFAVVGVIAVFYQKGTPSWLAQIYLVITSVIMAWQLGQFPEWSTWALVVVLAFYDLCAVLSPCGPLKWLVNLVQQEGRPLPGLLYEAEVKRSHAQYSPPRNDAMQRSPVGTTSSDGGGTRTEQYYQYDADDQLRAGSPHPIQASAEPPAAPVVTSPPRQSEHDEILKRRLTRFYEQYNPAMVPRIDQIVERYRGRERELWHNIYQKYAKDEGEEASTIKLGLGDFVFYSVLVSRAAMFDFAAMIGCMVTVLMGLGGTLFLLGIYNKALPALPISILLSVTVYFWMRFAYFPFLESYLTGVGFA